VFGTKNHCTEHAGNSFFRIFGFVNGQPLQKQKHLYEVKNLKKVGVALVVSPKHFWSNTLKHTCHLKRWSVKVHEGRDEIPTTDAGKPWRERKAKRGSALCNRVTPVALSTDTQSDQHSEVERAEMFAPPSTTMQWFITVW
jgi:hypothetical protein